MKRPDHDSLGGKSSGGTRARLSTYPGRVRGLAKVRKHGTTFPIGHAAEIKDLFAFRRTIDTSHLRNTMQKLM